MRPEQNSLWHELKGALLFILIFGGGAALSGAMVGLICVLFGWLMSVL